jgi:hypothetical protein
MVPPYTGVTAVGEGDAGGVVGLAVAVGEVPGLGEAGVAWAHADNSSITTMTRAIRTQSFFTKYLLDILSSLKS